MNLLAALAATYIARMKFNYNFKLLFSSLKFDYSIFKKTKSLAFSSLFITMNWILYYELDNLVIGKFSGVNDVAIYAIGLTVLTFFRSILGILFSPFDARFNHFIGINNIPGLKNFYLNIVTFTAPLVVIPIISISLFAKPLVLSWVGPDYIQSVQIVKIIVLSNIFAFISYPASSLLMAQERMKELNVFSSIKPLMYWIGIGLTYSLLGLKAFAIFKFLAFMVSAIFLYLIMVKFLELNTLNAIKKIFLPLLPPLIILIILSQAIKGFMPTTKSLNSLLLNTALIATSLSISFLMLLISSKRWRNQVYEGLKSVIKNEPVVKAD
jgi:O-antigen/teichoic acid export membrane protein